MASVEVENIGNQKRKKVEKCIDGGSVSSSVFQILVDGLYQKVVTVMREMSDAVTKVNIM
jgi:hypothetical protein